MDDKTGKTDKHLELNASINEAKSTAELEANYLTRLPKSSTRTPYQESEISIGTVVFNEKSKLLIKKGNSSSLRLQNDQFANRPKRNKSKNKRGTHLCFKCDICNLKIGLVLNSL